MYASWYFMCRAYTVAANEPRREKGQTYIRFLRRAIRPTSCVYSLQVRWLESLAGFESWLKLGRNPTTNNLVFIRALDSQQCVTQSLRLVVRTTYAGNRRASRNRCFGCKRGCNEQ